MEMLVLTISMMEIMKIYRYGNSRNNESIDENNGNNYNVGSIF